MAFQAGAIVGEMRLDLKPFLGSIKEATQAVQQLTQTMQRAQIEQKFAQEFARTRVQVAQTGASISGLIGLVTRLGLAYVGVRSVVQFYRDSVAAANEAERATAILATTVGNAGIRFEAVQKDVEQFTVSLSRLSGFSRTELVASVSDAVASTQDLERSLRIVSVAADLARAKGIGLQEAVLLISRATEFGIVRLRSLGIRIREGATDLEILDEVSRRVAGSAAAFGETGAGASAKYQNAVAELKQEIGVGLAAAHKQDLESLTQSVEAMTLNIQTFRKWREEVPLWRAVFLEGIGSLIRRLNEAQAAAEGFRAAMLTAAEQSARAAARQAFAPPVPAFDMEKWIRDVQAGRGTLQQALAVEGYLAIREEASAKVRVARLREVIKLYKLEGDQRLAVETTIEGILHRKDRAQRGANEALQRALQIYELTNLVTGRGAAERIADLERIRRLYAKSADEQLRLLIMIAQEEKQLRADRFRAATEDAENSRRYIQGLVNQGASFREIVAAYERAIARVNAIRATDAEQAKAKADLLKSIARDMLDYEVRATKEAQEKIRAVRQSALADVAKLTSTEFQIRRQEIEDELRERLRAVASVPIFEARDAAAREAILRAYWLKRQQLDRDMRRAELQAAIEAADAEAAVSERFAGQVTQARIDARRRALKELTEGTAEYNRLLAEIRGLERERAQQIVEQTDAMVDLGLATRAQAIEARRALLGTLIPNSAEWLRLLKEIQNQLVDLSGDPWVALRAAIEDSQRQIFGWREAWAGAIQSVTSSLASTLTDILTMQKGLLEGIREFALEVVRDIVRIFAEFAARDIVQKILALLKLPALPEAAPMAAGAAAAAPVLTAAVAGGGVSAAAAISTTFAIAITELTTSFLAAGSTVAAEIAAAMSLGIFGGRAGGILPGIALAQRGGVAVQPTLLAIAEGLPRRREMLLPLPEGLTPEALSRIVQRGGAGGDGGAVTITYTGDLHFRDERDIRAHAREVADAVRYAKRGNHPFMREDR